MLNKYYTLTDDTPAYAAAVLLDPTKRQAYIEKNWPSVWHSDVIGKVMQLWEAEYKHKRIPSPLQNSFEVPASNARTKTYNEAFKQCGFSTSVLIPVSLKHETPLGFVSMKPNFFRFQPVSMFQFSVDLA